MDYGAPFAKQCNDIEAASAAAEETVALQEDHVPLWREFTQELSVSVDPEVRQWLGALRAEIARQPELAPLYRQMRRLSAIVGLTRRHPLGLWRRLLNLLVTMLLKICRVWRVIVLFLLVAAAAAGLTWLIRNWDHIVSAIRFLLGMS